MHITLLMNSFAERKVQAIFGKQLSWNVWQVYCMYKVIWCVVFTIHLKELKFYVLSLNEEKVLICHLGVTCFYVSSLLVQTLAQNILIWLEGVCYVCIMSKIFMIFWENQIFSIAHRFDPDLVNIPLNNVQYNIDCCLPNQGFIQGFTTVCLGLPWKIWCLTSLSTI